MKKLISLMIAVLMLFSLAACGEAPASSVAETEPTETSAPKTEDGRPVTEVTTVDELLAAIAPNTVIELTGQRYMLTEASDYGTGSGSGITAGTPATARSLSSKTSPASPYAPQTAIPASLPSRAG